MEREEKGNDFMIEVEYRGRQINKYITNNDNIIEVECCGRHSCSIVHDRDHDVDIQKTDKLCSDVDKQNQY